jgi:mRNA interferase MazF
MEIKQYQIILVNLDPTMGSEIKKTGPCVVISPDEMNKYLRTVVIAPMTTVSRKCPTRVEIKHDNKTGWIILDQIRTIDKQRII